MDDRAEKMEAQREEMKSNMFTMSDFNSWVEDQRGQGFLSKPPAGVPELGVNKERVFEYCGSLERGEVYR